VLYIVDKKDENARENNLSYYSDKRQAKVF